jgi:hypothetical protein
MRIAALCLGLALGLIAAYCQPPWYEPYLLRTPAHLDGTVVDSQGRAINGVRISNLEIDGHVQRWVEVGADGRFQFHTRAPAVVFRKKGYQSKLVHIENKRIRIVMSAAGEPPRLPMCAANAACVSNGMFCLPKVEGLRFGKLDQGFDASVRTVTAPSLSGQKTILTHGYGASWVGEPRLEHVWPSIEYSEKYGQAHGLTVIDARGKTEDGGLWRNIGVDYERPPGGNEAYHVGESVYYGRRAPSEAALLDRVLDGLCIVPVPEVN